MKNHKIWATALLCLTLLTAETAFSQVRVNVNVGGPYYRYGYGRHFYGPRPYYRPAPVFVAPPPVYVAPPPPRFWVPGYWTYNRWGRRFWVNGFWRY